VEPPRRASGVPLLVALLSALPCLWLAADIARQPSITGRVWPDPVVQFATRDRLLVDLGLWWLLFAVGTAAVLRSPRRLAVGATLVVAVLLRVAALDPVPTLSNDLYRYAWDGKVQAAGIDPYRYSPEAPEVAHLRDPWLWPDEAGCAEFGREPGCTLINRRAERTIYPPVAQAWFVTVHTVLPEGARAIGWELTGLVVDIGVMGLLLLLSQRWGRDPRWLVLYAWCPLAVLEAVANAHVDGLAVLLMLLTLVAVDRRRSALAGGLLAAATLVKVYPAALLPLVVRRRPLGAVLAFVGVVAAAYLPHLLAVGARVLGYLPGYLREERYTEGARYLLLRPFGVEGLPASILAAGALGAAALYVLRRGGNADPPDAAARLLLGVLLLVVTPAQPWYALGLVAFAALGGAWWWLGVGVAGYATYVPGLIGKDAGTVGPIAYGLATALVGAAALLQRRRRAPDVAHR